jgi:hypothetical protein
MNIIFRFENLKKRDNSGYLDVDGRIILQSILRKYGEKVWFGFIWLRAVTSDRHL